MEVTQRNHDDLPGITFVQLRTNLLLFTISVTVTLVFLIGYFYLNFYILYFQIRLLRVSCSMTMTKSSLKTKTSIFLEPECLTFNNYRLTVDSISSILIFTEIEE